MQSAHDVLDRAFDRIAQAGFETPNGFLNHGPMACEALIALGREDAVEEWANRFARGRGPMVEPVDDPRFDWIGAIGDRSKLPEWIGYYERALETDGWKKVIATRVPHLLAGLPTVLFHGVIRTAHATRAIEQRDSPSRRAELARALGYWSAHLAAGTAEPTSFDARDLEAPGVAADACVHAAAEGARCFVKDPGIVELHGVTGAMAVSLLLSHLDPKDQAHAVLWLRHDHAALYGATYDQSDTSASADTENLTASNESTVNVAVASFDPHQVKLVEACRRGFTLSGDSIFLKAALEVTGIAA